MFPHLSRIFNNPNGFILNCLLCHLCIYLYNSTLSLRTSVWKHCKCISSVYTPSVGKGQVWGEREEDLKHHVIML